MTANREHNQVVKDNLGKANILNNQFASVFTVDNDDNEQMPALKTPTCPDIQPIHIETQGIYTLLPDLDPHKAFGPDGIPTKLLKELAYSVVPVLPLYLMHPYIKVNYLLTGRLPQWYLYLRKALELILLIIGQYL